MQEANQEKASIRSKTCRSRSLEINKKEQNRINTATYEHDQPHTHTRTDGHKQKIMLWETTWPHTHQQMVIGRKQPKTNLTTRNKLTKHEPWKNKQNIQTCPSNPSITEKTSMLLTKQDWSPQPTSQNKHCGKKKPEKGTFDQIILPHPKTKTKTRGRMREGLGDGDWPPHLKLLVYSFPPSVGVHFNTWTFQLQQLFPVHRAMASHVQTILEVRFSARDRNGTGGQGGGWGCWPLRLCWHTLLRLRPWQVQQALEAAPPGRQQETPEHQWRWGGALQPHVLVNNIKLHLWQIHGRWE